MKPSILAKSADVYSGIYLTPDDRQVGSLGISEYLHSNVGGEANYREGINPYTNGSAYCLGGSTLMYLTGRDWRSNWRSPNIDVNNSSTSLLILTKFQKHIQIPFICNVCKFEQDTMIGSWVINADVT